MNEPSTRSSGNHDRAVTRRRFLRTGVVLSTVATTGCSGSDDEPVPGDEETAEGRATATSSPTITSTPTPGQVPIDPYSLAGDAQYWAWYPNDPALWSRSDTSYDFRHAGGQWLAEPIDGESIRCRVENDPSPGNAGFYFDVGPVGDIGSITVESETSRSDGDNQSLLVALYFDVTADGSYFEWESGDDREAFVDLGGDAEVLGLFPAGGTVTIDDNTELDLVPPLEEELVTFGALKRGEIADVTPLTAAAIQISVVGSGDGNTEEAIVHEVNVEEPDPIPAKSWPMFSHDAINTGHNADTVGPTGAIEAQWTFETGGAVRSSPAVVRGTVFVGSDDGYIYALDANTGEEEWAFATNGPVTSSPAVLGHMVYVGSHDHRVYALSAARGDPVWEFRTGGRVRSSPTVEANSAATVVDDVVAIGSDDGTLYALDATSGEPLKTIRTDGPVVAAPTILVTMNGYWELGFGSADGNTHYWVPDFQGGHVNSLEAGAPVHAPISLPAGRSENIWYRANDDGKLRKFVKYPNAVWTFEAKGNIRTTPVLAGEMVYVGSWDGSVYAVDTESGDEEWSFETGGRVDSSPAVADGVLYVGSADHHTYALDAETGDELWSFETGEEVSSSPAVVDGIVYIGSDDGTVYALAEPAD